MKRLLATLTIALACAAALPATAGAAFGINNFDVAFTDKAGEPAEAGSHPFALTVSLGTNFDGALIPEGWIRDISVAQAPGLGGDTTAYPRCTTAQFLNTDTEFGEPNCAPETQLGIAAISVSPGIWETFPLFNVEPPPGTLLRIGFHVVTQNVYLDVALNNSPPYNAIGASRNTPQILNFFGAKLQLWGHPADPAHDELRGSCGRQVATLPPGEVKGFQFKETGKTCKADENPEPFLTMPTNCTDPLRASWSAFSWNDRDGDGAPDTDKGSTEAPAPRGCGKLTFNPSIDAVPTNRAASSPSGLDFELRLKDEGLTSSSGLAASQMRKAVVTLPVGMTINPSQAEGLEVCSIEDLNDETLAAEPGEGCPQASKVGTVEAESPQVSEAVKGSLFVAEPYRNLAGDSLIAVYLVVKNKNLGVIVKQALRVDPDPKTGQLVTTTVGDVPQVFISSFRLHFREGGRSPLVTPPRCGTYEVSGEFTPWSGGAPAGAASAFRVQSGPSEGPCPTGPTPFEPGFQAGSQSNAGGRYSPFSMRLTRRDGDQDLTRFDAGLPPGVTAKLAGVSKCPDSQIALAKAKTGIAELASPSCPLNSRIGGVIGGAGVGSQLTYVRGSIYLAGPFAGAPLSVVAVVPAVAGPFDVGTVVVRQALQINPRTGEVTADGAKSDPLPHILAGIPLVVREIQVNVDRSGFSLNPTSCDPFATRASIWGGGADAFERADDAPIARQARYQAASCASLGFKSNLAFKFKGGTKRGDHPSLRSTYKPRQGDANLKQLVLRFPRSAFLDQGHIKTICTRVQFAAGSGHGAACPKGAVYGHARAFTPLLDEPLEGPIFLRSSDNNLPDLVAALRGVVDVEAVARIDSKRGGIRLTFTGLPDAPLTKVVVTTPGGKKGLIVNSRDICASKNRANAAFTAHNAKQQTLKPVMRASCPKGKKRPR